MLPSLLHCHARLRDITRTALITLRHVTPLIAFHTFHTLHFATPHYFRLLRLLPAMLFHAIFALFFFCSAMPITRHFSRFAACALFRFA